MTKTGILENRKIYVDKTLLFFKTSCGETSCMWTILGWRLFLRLRPPQSFVPINRRKNRFGSTTQQQPVATKGFWAGIRDFLSLQGLIQIIHKLASKKLLVARNSHSYHGNHGSFVFSAYDPDVLGSKGIVGGFKQLI